MHDVFPVSEDLAAVPSLRCAIGDYVHACAPSADADTIRLLVTELMTNAIRHGDPPRSIVIDVDGAVVRVSVEDGCRATPVDLEPPPEADRGRGLMLVDRLADRWGVDPLPVGKAVWFEVRTPTS